MMISEAIETIERFVGEHRLKLATAESCTGGRVAAALTQRAGASGFYVGGVVAYANDFKTGWLGVPQKTLAEYGAVSEETARAMCDGVCGRDGAAATAAVAVTGIAGPGGGSESKPVGTVCFAVRIEAEVFSVSKHFDGAREAVQNAAAEEALVLLAMLLSQHKLPD